MKIDLRGIDERLKAGLSTQDSKTVSQPSQKKKRDSSQEHRGKHETRKLIYMAISDSSRGLSLHEIAKAIGRAKTPHLRSIVSEMVGDGILLEVKEPHPATGFMYRYEVL